MFDIVPPSRPESARRVPRRRQPQAQLPNTVKLSWKLPARLRRPIQKELSRQRRVRAATDQPVQFRRRPIITPQPTAARRGVALLPTPPYRGRFALNQGGKNKRPQEMARRSHVRPVSVSRGTPVRIDASDEIISPVHMNITLPSEAGEGPSTRVRWTAGLKKLWRKTGSGPLPNLLLFVAGTGFSAFVVWHLQGVGAGLAIFDQVKAQTQQAYEHLGAAQSAFAATNFSESGEAFQSAETLLTQAQGDLDAALSQSRAVLTYVDVSGTVRSGTNVLVAGEALARAGQHLSEGASFLFSGKTDANGQPLSLTMALAKARPELQQASDDLARAEQALDKISDRLVPESAREQWEALRTSVPQARRGIDIFLAQSDALFQVLGADRPRQYLIAFQNNHELRPTGGFIGSLALVNVDEGVMEQVDVQSVYDPDGQLRDFIAPPSPLRHLAPRWWLRDANWFVDYKVSAKKIASFFEKEGGPTVDGVIAMTPEVVRQLLEVVGPIDMPTYGVIVTADNFIPLTQDQVTYNYDREANRPKQFLADLTPLLLNRLFEAPSELAWKSLGVLSGAMSEKHILLYFRDEALQKRVEEVGWAGRLPVTPTQNFLTVNSANLGGNKSDQFVDQEIDVRTEIAESGAVEVVLTIRRTHRGPEEALAWPYPEGENPAEQPNIVFQRVLVPLGAELLEAKGFSSIAEVPTGEVSELPVTLTADSEVAVWEQGLERHETGTIIGQEAERTFFGNWLVTPPGSTVIGLYRYRVPAPALVPGVFNLYERYGFQFVKQPGDMRTSVRVDFHLPAAWRVVQYLPTSGTTQTAPESLVYRGQLRQDTLIGFVYGKR